VQTPTSIPDSVQLLVITVEVTSILSNAVIRKMRHSSKVCLQMAESDVSSSIVVNIQISEATTIMQRFDRVVPRTGDLEPQRLINADVLGSI
jgi:NifU-like protein involved in Fe-S cluster formation